MIAKNQQDTDFDADFGRLYLLNNIILALTTTPIKT